MLFCCLASPVKAQTDSTLAARQSEVPVITRQTMLGFGHAGILDTYLSPEKYGGPELHFMQKVARRRLSRNWYREMTHHGSFAYADYRDDNGREIFGQYRFQFAWLRKFIDWSGSRQRFRLAAGPKAEADIGFLYNTRNGNNPAQGTFHIDGGATLQAQWDFTSGRRHYALTYEATVPLVGLMFTPQFGQSYYEIFSRGNYDHNIQPIWPGNSPSLEQQLMFRFDIGRTTLTLGYLGDYRQYEVNQLKYHHYSHALMIGIVKCFSLTKIHP